MINIHVSNYIEKIIFNEKKKEKKKKGERVENAFISLQL